MKFHATTDNVDIGAKAVGVHPIKGPDNRGLCVQITHNADKKIFKTACEMAKVIEKALNEHFSKTPLRDRLEDERQRADIAVDAHENTQEELENLEGENSNLSLELDEIKSTIAELVNAENRLALGVATAASDIENLLDELRGYV